MLKGFHQGEKVIVFWCLIRMVEEGKMRLV